jgi:hypothetical protein
MCSVAFVLATAVQAGQTTCADLTYESRNQIDYGPLRVSVISGIAQDAEGGRIPDVCVGVFTEKEHRLVAMAHSDESGRFELKAVPVGKYRLVAKYEGFCPANARLRIGRLARRKKLLTVQVRPTGIDTCSYIELK